MRGRRTRSGVGGDRGAAALEFALVVPLLLYLVMGVIGYGYMLSFRQAISQAASEASRAAAVAPAQLTDAQVTSLARNAIDDALQSYGVTCSTSNQLLKGGKSAGACTITPPQTCTGSASGALCVKVTLTYDYRANSLTGSLPFVDSVMPRQLSFVTESQVS